MLPPEPYALTVDAAVPMRCPAFALEDLRVKAGDAALKLAIELLSDEYHAKFAGLEIGQVPGISEVRASYKALGIDPTKTRPSSEALLRRVLKGQGLYTVNTLVDALNFCSLRYLVPFGLYDLAKVQPPVAVRVGQEGEGYEGIRKDRVNVAGRACLADAEGPFGNPTSDSDRTKITLETTRALVVPFLPLSLNEARVKEIMEGTAVTLRNYSA
ncbi:MAG: hypothetical protein HY291_09425 [Planctomycetes bacterium]|nr:hypothetical protein [Planctomycetota bacterium]